MADAMTDVRRGTAGKWRSLKARVTTSGTTGQIDVGFSRIVFASMSAVNASEDQSVRINLNSASAADGTTRGVFTYTSATSAGVYEVYAEGK